MNSYSFGIDYFPPELDFYIILRTFALRLATLYHHLHD